MKKTNLIKVFAMLCAFVSTTTSFAQYAKNSNLFSADLLYGSLEDMPGISEESDEETKANMKVINARMYKDFTRFYGKATDIKMSVKESHTFVSCNLEGVPTKILYGSKGQWRHTLKYLNPAQIPSDVKRVIANEFEDYTITSATEVIVGNKTAYLVNIENSASLKIIRVIDEDWDIYKDLSRQ